jgi:Protein of Unknown function (DUF2784)
MLYRLSADLVLIVHLAFVLFVMLGGLLVLRRPRLMWLHLPAVVWGALSEFLGVFCPLTPLETTLRKLGGGSGYEGDFIAHYVTAVIYPSGLTREIQIALGFGALLLNMAIYGYGMLRKRRSLDRSRRSTSHAR